MSEEWKGDIPVVKLQELIATPDRRMKRIVVSTQPEVHSPSCWFKMRLFSRLCGEEHVKACRAKLLSLRVSHAELACVGAARNRASLMSPMPNESQWFVF